MFKYIWCVISFAKGGVILLQAIWVTQEFKIMTQDVKKMRRCSEISSLTGILIELYLAFSVRSMPFTFSNKMSIFSVLQ